MLATRREPRAPEEGALDLVYVFDGAAYQERARTQQGARCDVQPADCDLLIRSTCRFESSPNAGQLDKDPNRPILALPRRINN